MFKKVNTPRLSVIPLGGMGEIGKNMTVFEYMDDIIVVDVGSIFPREDMPGVDLVIPDTSYLEKNQHKIRAYFITHGHEDHIGALPYVVRKLPAPLYGTSLTCALCEHKLKEHRLNGVIELNHNSLGGLGSYYELVDAYPMMQGGYIWDYIDQAIMVKDEVTGREVIRYGGDFDDRPADYEFSGNGIVFADRTEKPALQEVKYYYGLHK